MRGDRGATVKVASGTGLIKLRTTTLNQDGEAVLVYVVNMVVRCGKDIR
jgi:acyl dehydratase